MEFQSEYEPDYNDTLFDAFNINFYEDIQFCLEYRTEHIRAINEKKYNPDPKNPKYTILCVYLSCNESRVLVIPSKDAALQSYPNRTIHTDSEQQSQCFDDPNI